MLKLCSCEFGQLQHWAEFQRILPNPNSCYGVLSDYRITSLCTSMGFRNDHRFHCSETFRQNGRACVPYHGPFHDWNCEFYYFPQHDKHRQSLCRFVRIPLFHKILSKFPSDSWLHNHLPASLYSTHGSQHRYRGHPQSEQ